MTFYTLNSQIRRLHLLNMFEILLLPLFAGVGWSSIIPQANAPVLPRSPVLPAVIVRGVDAPLEARIATSEVFDIGFELKDEELYSGYVGLREQTIFVKHTLMRPNRTWEFAPPKPLPVPGLPPVVTVEPKETIEFTLNCNDCRTYGEIVAEMDTEGDGVTFGLTFNRAGAYLDFGISATNTLTATFALGHFLSTGNLTVCYHPLEALFSKDWRLTARSLVRSRPS